MLENGVSSITPHTQALPHLEHVDKRSPHVHPPLANDSTSHRRRRRLPIPVTNRPRLRRIRNCRIIATRNIPTFRPGGNETNPIMSPTNTPSVEAPNLPLQSISQPRAWPRGRPQNRGRFHVNPRSQSAFYSNSSGTRPRLKHGMHAGPRREGRQQQSRQLRQVKVCRRSVGAGVGRVDSVPRTGPRSRGTTPKKCKPGGGGKENEGEGAPQEGEERAGYV